MICRPRKMAEIEEGAATAIKVFALRSAKQSPPHSEGARWPRDARLRGRHRCEHSACVQSSVCPRSLDFLGVSIDGCQQANRMAAAISVQASKVCVRIVQTEEDRPIVPATVER